MARRSRTAVAVGPRRFIARGRDEHGHDRLACSAHRPGRQGWAVRRARCHGLHAAGRGRGARRSAGMSATAHRVRSCSSTACCVLRCSARWLCSRRSERCHRSRTSRSSPARHCWPAGEVPGSTRCSPRLPGRTDVWRRTPSPARRSGSRRSSDQQWPECCWPALRRHGCSVSMPPRSPSSGPKPGGPTRTPPRPGSWAMPAPPSPALACCDATTCSG